MALLATPIKNHRVAERLLSGTLFHLTRLYLFLQETSGCLVTNRGALKELRASGQGRLIVANHPSMLDAPIFLSVIPNLLCVFKSALKQSLLLPNTARVLGFLGNDEGMDMLRDLINSLRSGKQFLLFPEGTRTGNRPLNDFNKSYALAALKAKVPLHLVCIRTESPILSKKQHFLKPARFPVIFNLEIGPVIEPGEFRTVRDLDDFVESWYRHALAQPSPAARAFLPNGVRPEQVDTGLHARFRIPENPFYCRGHMPGNPIVPGFVQMAWARELLQCSHLHDTGLIQHKRWKFLKPLLPGELVDVVISGDSQNYRVVISRDDTPVSRGNIHPEVAGKSP
jgi:1-acyl-sn-glycerol-3-phosphate acyltransferase